MIKVTKDGIQNTGEIVLSEEDEETIRQIFAEQMDMQVSFKRDGVWHNSYENKTVWWE